MKKVLGILVVSAALVGFTACGGDDSANETGTAAGILAAQLEEKGAAQGMTFDVDCTIKKLVKMSVEDLTIWSDNIDSEGDPADLGMSEEGQGIVDAIGSECVTMSEDAADGAADDGSADTTMP